MKTDWINAEEALATLSIKPQSLYAYVSRGILRAQADPHDSRRSLYSRHDVMKLLERKRRPRARAEVAAAAIAWGDPVLESGISTVRDRQLYFGSQRATDLAETASLEDVAAMHWGQTRLPKPVAAHPIPGHDDAKTRGYFYLASEAANGAATLGRAQHALASRDAAFLLSGFANAMLGQAIEGPIHLRLRKVWGLSETGADIVRRALVLLSDHELNPSSFAVRVAASTGTPLAAAALAGYATLNGPRHGDASTRAYQFFRAACDGESLNTLISRQGRVGAYTMGFGHTLYPEGDPRAAHILSVLNMSGRIANIIAETSDIIGHKPNIDAALAALTLELDLPKDAPFCLFAIGRMAGWLAHAMEQVSSGQLIRPRANFVAREAAP